MRIEPVREETLDELLPLLRGYCDFYAVSPSDAELLTLARALLADSLAPRRLVDDDRAHLRNLAVALERG